MKQNPNNLGLLCHQGIEEIVATFCSAYGEITLIRPGLVILNTTKPHLIALYSGANRIIEILHKGSWNDLLAHAATLPIEKEFHVHSFSTDPTAESAQEQREALVQALALSGKHWNPKKPAVHLYLVFDEKEVFLGKDIIGVDLGKRTYKAYQRQPPLRGPFAWALWQFLGLKPNLQIWCPHILDGTIPIEAALFQSGVSPWQFTLNDWEAQMRDLAKKHLKNDITKSTVFAWSDQWPHISASKANAKLAGIEKGITFSKQTLDWADLKFEEKTFDLVGAHIVGPSPHNPKAGKYFEELCKQAEYLLKPKGKIGVISTSLVGFKAEAEKHNLKLLSQHMWWMGKQELFVEIYQK